jgi:AcrR family transcriptional regulator
VNAGRTARERARTELTREIKEAARGQLAAVGADGLSLRAVARELGMVSSALYRYFASRDDLLTALIVDGYESLALAAEAADKAARGAADEAAGGAAGKAARGAAGGVPGELAAGADGRPRTRLRAVCAAIRAWAHAHPHEYALLFGSPVPGYQAPQATVGPAARIPLVLLEIVRAGRAGGGSGAGQRPMNHGPGRPLPVLSPLLESQLRAVAEQFAPELPDHLMATALIAWTQLFGMLSFELFGQLVGSVDPSDDFFGYAVERMADQLDLPPDPGR